MPWTAEQLAELDENLAAATLRERYGDKEVWYRSLEDTIRIRALVADEVNGTAGRGQRVNVQIQRGLHE